MYTRIRTFTLAFPVILTGTICLFAYVVPFCFDLFLYLPMHPNAQIRKALDLRRLILTS